MCAVFEFEHSASRGTHGSSLNATASQSNENNPFRSDKTRRWVGVGNGGAL